MEEEKRIQVILDTIKKIKASELSIEKYFKTKYVPFSQAQYYSYCKILKEYGKAGLRDKRKNGNATKLTQELKHYIIFTVKEHPTISSSKLAIKIQNEFKKTISRHTLNNFRKSKGLKRQSTIRGKEHKVQKSGGGEILTSLACFTKIIDLLTKTIIECANEVRELPLFEKNKAFKKDHPKYRLQGKFTKRYNQLKQVRENRFKSIDEKIPKKNYSSMNIFKLSQTAISRYNLALLSLPLVTMNGKSSRINRVKGNDLDFLCGYNYKDSTLDKYLRELKYLKVAEKLIMETAKFWINFWRDKSEEETYFVCYYIDGNTKALWSSGRFYKGKVTMVGRVMNCLENVFIHDGKGHPLYFQTFRGHADLGNNALSMISKLTKYLDDTSAHVKRILVMDGGGNSVKTMRAFGSDEYFITILDKNQVKERKIRNIRRTTRYKQGEANLVDCKIELIDSSEKDYIYESRAVIVKWDNGRESVLITNIPIELLDASAITKKYFDRWPKQEKRFRDAKSGVNIHRVVGYGKKIEKYSKMNERHRKISKAMNQLKAKLKKPLKEIEELEEKLVRLYKREKKIREKVLIKHGKRVLCDSDSIALKQCESQITKCIREQKNIEKEYKYDFDKLKKYVKEENRIRDKNKVYKIDIELDQIMTCFKLSFINLCSFLLKECMNNERFELLTLYESIFQLEGNVIITDKEKRISLKKNEKEPKVMEKLKKCIKKLNSMKIKDLEGRIIQFAI